MRKLLMWLVVWSFVAAPAAFGARQTEGPDSRILPGSRVFIAPMNGFETYLIAAFSAKKVPLVVVSSRDEADFELSGVSESEKPGWTRTLVSGQTGTDEQASIAVKNIKTGVVAFGYAVNLQNSLRGKQSAAESCAKHLKDKVEQDGKTVPSRRPAVVAASSASAAALAAPTVPRRSVAALVQLDVTDEEFVAALRQAFAKEGIDLRTVERGAAFDYNIILTRQKTSTGPAAAVVVLDANGRLITSSARTGFRSNGAAAAASEEVAKKVAAALR